MKKRRIVILLFILSLLVGGVYRYARTHGFSARETPNALEAYFAKTVRRYVVPAATRELKNPLSATPLIIAEARDHFAGHCASCHANDGSGRTPMGRNMYPPVPDMRSGYTQSLTDGELFYIIKEGIRFSGMPGWGGDDDENWKLVSFIRHLPRLTDEEVEFMKEINNLELTSSAP